jgi:hypothetical protein
MITLEARNIRFMDAAVGAGGRMTISGQHVQHDVGTVAPCLLPRPSLWWADVRAQISQLLQLPANWDSYGADPVSDQVAQSTNGLLLALGGLLDLPRPLVSPTRRGGILLEWKSGPKEIEIEVVSRDAAAFLFTDDATAEEAEGELFREENLAASPVMRFLKQFA